MAVARDKAGINVDTDGLETAAWVFKALSDPARLKILAFLANQDDGKCCGTDEGICACDLEDVTDLSQPTVSHHMKCLVSANLVIAEKRGKWMFYRIDPEGFKYIHSFIKRWK
jgi:ArsR family transcriptional regulator, arsenate/arsenite/antimonite-responsive transcriptional repressor